MTFILPNQAQRNIPKLYDAASHDRSWESHDSDFERHDISEQCILTHTFWHVETAKEAKGEHSLGSSPTGWR